MNLRFLSVSLFLFVGVFAGISLPLSAEEMVPVLGNDPAGGGDGGGGGGGGGGGTGGSGGTSSTLTSEPYAIRGTTAGPFTNGLIAYRAGGGGTTANYGYVNLDELSYNCVTNATSHNGQAVVGNPIYKVNGEYYVYNNTGGYAEVCTNGLLVYADSSEPANGGGNTIGYIDLSELTQNVATQISSTNTLAIVGKVTYWTKNGPGSMWDYGYGYVPGVGGAQAQLQPIASVQRLLCYGHILASSGNRQGTYDSQTGYNPGSGNTYDLSYANLDLGGLTWNQAGTGIVAPKGSISVSRPDGGAGGVILNWSITPVTTN